MSDYDDDSVTNNLRDSANGTFVTLDDYLPLTKWGTRAPVLDRQAQFTKSVGRFWSSCAQTFGRFTSKPNHLAQTNMDVSVEGSCPVTVEEFGPTSADVVQEAEE